MASKAKKDSLESKQRPEPNKGIGETYIRLINSYKL
jgi:hypothetical protein